MDQPKTDKFSELSPVLELVYVMLTNMAKYMDVYAADIEADKTDQYVEAKEAIDAAIRKFDTLYGLKSPSSLPEGTVGEFEDDMTEDDTMPTEKATVIEKPAAPVQATTAPATEPKPEAQPYDFASGNDPESLKKAKQAVEELKTLFADMKKQEDSQAPVATPVATAPATVPVVDNAPSTPMPTPTFVAPVTSAPAPAPVTPAPIVSAPAPTTTPAGDANEIDSILAELKKLQNKGTTQL